MGDGMTDDDRRIIERWDRAGFVTARAVLAEAARTDDLAERLDEALTLLAEALGILSSPQAVPSAVRSEVLARTRLVRGLHRREEQVGRSDTPSTPESAAGRGESREEQPAPERYECSDGVTREPSGEVRPPRKGEWFVMSHSLCPFRAQFDFDAGQGRRILRPVQDPAPDWEARARKAEAEVARLRHAIDDEAAYLANAGVLGYRAIARRLRALLDPPGADQ